MMNETCRMSSATSGLIIPTAWRRTAVAVALDGHAEGVSIAGEYAVDRGLVRVRLFLLRRGLVVPTLV